MDYLTQNSEYLSPKLKSAWLKSKFPSYFFYKKLFSIVLKASKLAKKNSYNSDAWIKSSLNTVREMEAVGAVFEINNISAFKNLDQPVVFIGNHMSTLETFVLPCIIQPFRDVTFVVKNNLVEVPVFKHIMISRDPIVVGRTNPREDFQIVLNGGKEHLKNNISIIIFPQTTRYTDIDPKSFNSIGIKLAKREGVPVIPIALKTDAWGIGKLNKDLGKIDISKTVHICFGDPLYIKGNGKEEHEYIIRFIKQKLFEWSK